MNLRKQDTIPLYDDLSATSQESPVILKELTGENIRPGRQLPHRHPYYEIFWFHHGEGVFVNDFGRYPFDRSSLGFVAPGRIHYWDLQKETKGWLLAFTPEFLHPTTKGQAFTSFPVLSYLNHHPLLSAPEELTESLHVTFKQIHLEYRSEDPFRMPAIQALLSLLLIQCSRLLPTEHASASSASYQLTQRFIQMLNGSSPILRQVQEYAARLEISPHRLIESVKECTGRTAGSLIEERILAESKRLLWLTHLTVAEIAYTLDFKDPSHFGHFFKRQTGVSPGSARRQYAPSRPETARHT